MKDPIGFIDEVIMRMTYGDAKEILWWADSAHHGGDAEKLAVAYGVKVLGRRLGKKSGEDFGITVRANQAAYLDALMRCAGYSVTSPHLGKHFRVMPEPWGVSAKRIGFGGKLAWFLGVVPDFKFYRDLRTRQVADGGSTQHLQKLMNMLNGDE